MAFPPSFLDELRNRISLSDVIGRKVTWDQRKSAPGKGDYWACCPFHSEKSPSFHVLDRQGYFYCFGCHEKGNVFDFLMKTENMTFPEAVRRMAEEAGLPMPEESPAAAAREAKRRGLAEAMEAAVKYFRTHLFGARAEPARAYLAGRGLSAETVERFEIGFAPDARDGLTQHLIELGFDRATIVEAGLAGVPDRDRGERTPYDRFRGRIMFPIRDPRGRCVAFGGRLMAPHERSPKYLNSPETPLFQKGRTLYNHGPARAAAGAGAPLLVVEGYMDVIALAQAGFDAAVAPLGTALTEDQLAHLWRMADEPIIALDGDAAGLRAANRAAELALPALQPGKTLQFALLPDGVDPDDLIKSKGADAMLAVIGAAEPLIDYLWRREVAAARLETPERRAAFEARLNELAAKIGNEGIRRDYGFEFKDRRFRLMRERRGRSSPPGGRPSRGPGAGAGSRRGGLGPSVSRRDRGGSGATSQHLLRSLEATGAHEGDPLSARTAEARRRELVILTLLLNHPTVIERQRAAIESLYMVSSDLEAVKNALLAVETQPDGDVVDAKIAQMVGGDVIEAIRRAAGPGLPRSASPMAPTDLAETCFIELTERHSEAITWLIEADEFLDRLTDPEEDDAESCFKRLKEAHKTVSRNVNVFDVGGETSDEADVSTRLQYFVDGKPWIKRVKRAGGQ